MAEPVASHISIKSYSHFEVKGAFMVPDLVVSCTLRSEHQLILKEAVEVPLAVRWDGLTRRESASAFPSRRVRRHHLTDFPLGRIVKEGATSL